MHNAKNKVFRSPGDALQAIAVSCAGFTSALLLCAASLAILPLAVVMVQCCAADYRQTSPKTQRAHVLLYLHLAAKSAVQYGKQSLQGIVIQVSSFAVDHVNHRPCCPMQRDDLLTVARPSPATASLHERLSLHCRHLAQIHWTLHPLLEVAACRAPAQSSSAKRLGALRCTDTSAMQSASIHAARPPHRLAIV